MENYSFWKKNNIGDSVIAQVYQVYNDNESHEFFDVLFASKLAKGDNVFRNGSYEVFNEEGKPLIIGEYYQEVKIGTWLCYYYDEDILIKKEYVLNELFIEVYSNLSAGSELFSGKSTLIHKNTKEVRSIKKGYRNGKTIFYNLETDKKVKVVSYKDGKIKE